MSSKKTPRKKSVVRVIVAKPPKGDFDFTRADELQQVCSVATRAIESVEKTHEQMMILFQATIAHLKNNVMIGGSPLELEHKRLDGKLAEIEMEREAAKQKYELLKQIPVQQRIFPGGPGSQRRSAPPAPKRGSW